MIGQSQGRRGLASAWRAEEEQRPGHVTFAQTPEHLAEIRIDSGQLARVKAQACFPRRAHEVELTGRPGRLAPLARVENSVDLLPCLRGDRFRGIPGRWSARLLL